jgi:hypothetical protein
MFRLSMTLTPLRAPKLYGMRARPRLFRLLGGFRDRPMLWIGGGAGCREDHTHPELHIRASSFWYLVTHQTRRGCPRVVSPQSSNHFEHVVVSSSLMTPYAH